MKRVFVSLLAILSSTMLFAQQQDANAQVRNVSAFTGIKVSNGIELVLKQGSTEAVAVSASETEYRDRIKTEVENGVLKIYYDNGKMWKALDKKKKSLKAYVSAVTLKLLHANSGAYVNIEGSIKSDELDIEVTSGASVNGTLTGGQVKASLNSGASASLSGNFEQLTVKTSSGAHFKGFSLVTQNCEASASSGAKIEISVNKELDVHASSGGTVYYKGSCSVKNISINSGGSVKNKS